MLLSSAFPFFARGAFGLHSYTELCDRLSRLRVIEAGGDNQLLPRAFPAFADRLEIDETVRG
jgi:hypothetical protein